LSCWVASHMVFVLVLDRFVDPVPVRVDDHEGGGE
jgi:hypothetical protein